MPTFDGDNLVITLDSGVTEIDVIDNIYEPWKDWMLSSPINRKYPQAFVSDGGNPLSAIINQGSYIFLQNQYGWRIRPPEEDITIYLTGNLAVNTTTSPAFIPTVGAYTAAILGLQPVTQGVTPSMGTQLEQVSFEGGVAFAPIAGYATTTSGLNTDGDLIGTRKAPVNSVTGIHSLSGARGLRKIYLMEDATISTTDMSSHAHEWIGDNPEEVLTVDASANITGHAMTNLTVAGELDGLNSLQFCLVNAVTQISGKVVSCAFTSTVTLSGNLSLYNCYSRVTGAGHPDFTIGSNVLQVRDWHGSIGLHGMTAGDHTIEIYGGAVHIESDCTGGTIHVRGEPTAVNDDSGVGCTVLIETGTTAVWEYALEGTFTAEEVMRIMSAALAGKASGLDAAAPVFRDINDTKDRITATTDANGNRTAVTLVGS